MGNNSKFLIAIFYVFIRMMILLLEPKKNQMVNAADATYYEVPNFCVTRSTHLQDPYNDIPKFICSSLDWHGYNIAVSRFSHLKFALICLQCHACTFLCLIWWLILVFNAMRPKYPLIPRFLIVNLLKSDLCFQRRHQDITSCYI